MRSSYSMPCAFIAATASARAAFSCANRSGRGSSRTDSMTETTSRANVGDSGSNSSRAASAKGESGWLSAKSSGRSVAARRRGSPDAEASAEDTCSTTPACFIDV